jgi:hypothetical protein
MRYVKILILLVLLFCDSCSYESEPKESPKNSDLMSKDLTSTQIIPTLDFPIAKGENVIWCASFLSAWKALEKDIAGEPIALEGNPELASILGKAADPTSLIPSGSLYVAAGWNNKGITDKIAKDLKKLFPTKRAPSFPNIREDSFVAYSYLEANVKFTIPYFQSVKPLVFTSSDGVKTKIKSFGIRPEDDYAYYKLRKQLKILFRKGDPYSDGGKYEFAIDLCSDSSPSEIIVALIDKKPTLAETLDQFEKYCDKQAKSVDPEMGPNDVLLVPDIFFEIAHHYSKIEKKAFENKSLKGQQLDIARQDILFRLDRSGAELKSEAKVYCEPVPTYFQLDRPFLVIMRKRGVRSPYFVMWVDNAELLQKWNEK